MCVCVCVCERASISAKHSIIVAPRGQTRQQRPTAAFCRCYCCASCHDRLFSGSIISEHSQRRRGVPSVPQQRSPQHRRHVAAIVRLCPLLDWRILLAVAQRLSSSILSLCKQYVTEIKSLQTKMDGILNTMRTLVQEYVAVLA